LIELGTFRGLPQHSTARLNTKEEVVFHGRAIFNSSAPSKMTAEGKTKKKANQNININMNSYSNMEHIFRLLCF